MVSAPPAGGWLRFLIERNIFMIPLRNSVPLCGLNKPNDLRMAIRNSQILNRKSCPELASTNFDIRNSAFVIQYSFAIISEKLCETQRETGPCLSQMGRISYTDHEIPHLHLPSVGFVRNDSDTGWSALRQPGAGFASQLKEHSA
jgi:hypothetical protein